MTNKVFYGTDNNPAITYLEFGEVNVAEGKKKIWDFRLHQRAYDWLMLSRYSNDLLTYKAMEKMVSTSSLQDIVNLYNEEVHHADDNSVNLGKLIALIIMQKEDQETSFYELGQTIFGCIEGMQFYQRLLEHINVDAPKVDLKKVTWFGVDISEMLNQMSVLLHQDMKVVTVTEPAMLPDEMDVFFAKGISILYAVRDVSQFFATVQKGRCSVFDYSFNLGEDEDTTIGSGKTVRYLNYDEFIKKYREGDRKMYVNRSNSRYIPETNRIWLDCVYAPEDLCKKYIKLDQRVRQELLVKCSDIKEAERFLSGSKVPEWLPVEEFVASIKG